MKLYGAALSQNLIFIGLKFNDWTVVSFAGKSLKGHFTWNCVCNCGRVYTLHATSIRRKNSICCKICSSHKRKTHGETGSPTYKAWENMHSRCNGDERYIKRGIKVCKRWSKFENFKKDMGTKPINLSLDRQDNDLGYRKTNCRWATAKQQANNTSRNVNITYKDETKTLAEWATFLGLTRRKTARMFGVPS